MRYVEACRHNSWHLMLTEECIEDAYAVPYRCRSWRHEGDCCQWRGAQDFMRVSEGIRRFDSWVYVVLTFKQSEWWDWKEQYKLSYPMWSAMRCRITRRFGKFHYIQTWERHRKGGLHVNILISNESIFERCFFGSDEWVQLFLRPAAVDIGFGERCWCERMRDNTQSGMAGYLTKLSRELVGANEKGQIPYDAPPHFRRLRASRGVLPPPHKSNLAGWLVTRPMNENESIPLTDSPGAI